MLCGSVPGRSPRGRPGPALTVPRERISRYSTWVTWSVCSPPRANARRPQAAQRGGDAAKTASPRQVRRSGVITDDRGARKTLGAGNDRRARARATARAASSTAPGSRPSRQVAERVEPARRGPATRRSSCRRRAAHHERAAGRAVVGPRRGVLLRAAAELRPDQRQHAVVEPARLEVALERVAGSARPRRGPARRRGLVLVVSNTDRSRRSRTDRQSGRRASARPRPSAPGTCR